MTTQPQKYSYIKIGIFLLTVVTAAIHLTLAIKYFGDVYSYLFILNSLGYITLLVAYFLPQFARYHQQVRWLFIAFAAVTILAYIVVNIGHLFSPVGLITKIDEALLIVFLYLDKG